MVNEPRFSSTVSLVIRGTWKSSIRVLTSGCHGAVALSRSGRARRWKRENWLLGVELDDELLLHRRGDLAALRLAQDLGRERVVVGLQPRRDLRGQLGRVTDERLDRRPRLHGDD